MHKNLKLIIIFVSLFLLTAIVLVPYAKIHFWLPAPDWNKHNITATPLTSDVCHTQKIGYKGSTSTTCYNRVKFELKGATKEMSWTSSDKITQPFQTAVWQYQEDGEIRQEPESSVAAKTIRVVLLVSWITGLLYGIWSMIKLSRARANRTRQ